jgi:hypothetical protein
MQYRLNKGRASQDFPRTSGHKDRWMVHQFPETLRNIAHVIFLEELFTVVIAINANLSDGVEDNRVLTTKWILTDGVNARCRR